MMSSGAGLVEADEAEVVAAARVAVAAHRVHHAVVHRRLVVVAVHAEVPVPTREEEIAQVLAPETIDLPRVQ